MDPKYQIPVVLKRYVDPNGIRHSVVEDWRGVADFIELDGHHADLSASGNDNFHTEN